MVRNAAHDIGIRHEAVIAEVDSARAYLPENRRVGFIRYIKTGNTWEPDSGYRMNIVPLPPPPRVSVDTHIPVKVTSLGQNFPNPFNVSTQIPFNLKNHGHVVLEIYNALGQVVRTPVNQQVRAGEHVITFDARDLPVGIYYYRLRTTNEFQQMGSMIHLK